MATAMEVIATGPNAKCSLRYALSAAKTPKYLLNPAVTDRFTVAIVIVKSDQPDNPVWGLEHTQAGYLQPVYIAQYKYSGVLWL
jgi:hypothetical protein